MKLPAMGWKFKMTAKHYYYSRFIFGIGFGESDLKVEYHIKQTNK